MYGKETMKGITIKNGLTVKDMAVKLGIPTNTVKKRLQYRGIKPICKDALYDPSALDIIKDFAPKGFQPGNKAQSANKKKPAGKGKDKK
jgi:hypothetical protein